MGNKEFQGGLRVRVVLKGLVMYIGFRGEVKERGPVYTLYGAKKKKKKNVGWMLF